MRPPPGLDHPPDAAGAVVRTALPSGPVSYTHLTLPTKA